MTATILEKDLKSLSEALRIGFEKVGSELNIVLQAAGYPVTKEDVKLIADEIGIRDNEPLNIEKVCLVASKLPDHLQASTIMNKAFMPMDKHKEGTITVEDLTLVLENMAELKKDEIEMLIEELDPDDVGRVYFDTIFNKLNSKNLSI